MQVFKTMIKIVRNILPIVLMYLIGFTAIGVSVSSVNAGGNSTNFSQTAAKVAVVNEDGESKVAQALLAFLEERHKIVEIGEGEQAQQDALFFEKADCIITVPAGFSDNFFAGKEMGTESGFALKKLTIPSSVNGMYVSVQVDDYFKTLLAYRNNTSLTFAEMAEKTQNDLKYETSVTIADQGAVNYSTMAYFYNYQTYTLICVLGFSIMMLLSIFQKPALSMRCQCSYVSQSSVTRQKYLFLMILTACFLVVENVIGMVVHRSNIFTANGGFMMLNQIVLSVTIFCAMVFASSFRLSDLGINALVNVTGLACSFLSGVFVPQYLLSSRVLTVAHFIPTYWFVTGNNMIAETSVFTGDVVGTLLGNMGIMLLFAAAFLILSILINSYKRRQRLK